MTGPAPSAGPEPAPVFLLSDFGEGDAFVGVMKAVIAGLAPRAPLIDLVHAIPPQDVLAAQLQLEAVLPYLPDGSVLLAVVDPGVGSARRGVAVEVDLPAEATPGGSVWAIAPDNGLLTPLLADGTPRSAVRLQRGAVRPPGPGTTFDGRDLFAPAAGALASGTAPRRLGEPVDPASLQRLPLPEPRREGGGWLGEVVHVDRFGNLVTNLRARHLPDGATSIVRVAGHELRGVRDAFASVDVGAPLAYLGSLGRLELALRDGDAATSWGASRGTPVTTDSAT